MLTIHISKNNGATLISTLIYSTIGMILLGAALHGLHIFIQSNKKITLQFKQQQAILLIQYYFKRDIYNAGFQGCLLQRPVDFKRVSSCNPKHNNCDNLLDLTILNLIHNNELLLTADILLLHNIAATPLPNCDYIKGNTNLTLSNTTIVYYLKKSITKNNSYALYRADTQHQAIALIEDLSDMRLVITTHGSVQLISVNINFTNGTNTNFLFSTRNGN